MCGRYVIVSPPEALRRLFGYGEQPNLPPRYNVAPTQPVPVVTHESGVRHLRLMRWGFLPAWLKDPRGFPLLINARGETIADKAAFRNAIRRRRCLLPADGYYEWQAQGPRKQPFYIHPRDGGPIALAGVAETWCGPNGEEIDTVAIVTAAAPPELAALHHRVPVTIAPEDIACWLDPSADLRTALALAAPPPAGRFAWHPVSAAVNRVSNDDPRLIVALSEDELAAEARRAATPLARARPARTAAKADETQGSLF